MVVWYPEYKIAVGHDNAAGLATLEGVTVANDFQPFVYPRGIKEFDRGIRRTRGGGRDYWRGFAATAWVFGVMTWRQWAWLKDTYCDGGYDGLVTVRTRTAGLTYANYNAVLKLPKEVDLRNAAAPVIPDVQLTFTRLVALGGA